MPKNPGYELYCPECDKKAGVAMPMFIRGARRIQLPIFLCSECRTIYIDKPAVRRAISEWREKDEFSRNWAPFQRLYKDLFGKLEEMIATDWVPRLGYKRIRFQKRPAKPNPR